MNHTILLIEDNPDILKINRTALTMSDDYRVLEAKTLEQGKKLLDQECPDLLILDVLLPDGNGLALCKEIRAGSDFLILFLSALGENRDIINGLASGVDDYLPKPYDLDVLLARVKALLRRVAPKPQIVRLGMLTFDPFSQRALINSEDILLTTKEFALLWYLIQNKEKNISARRLYAIKSVPQTKLSLYRKVKKKGQLLQFRNVLGFDH